MLYIHWFGNILKHYNCIENLQILISYNYLLNNTRHQLVSQHSHCLWYYNLEMVKRIHPYTVINTILYVAWIAGLKDLILCWYSGFTVTAKRYFLVEMQTMLPFLLKFQPQAKIWFHQSSLRKNNEFIRLTFRAVVEGL